jgi:hypothetical protein
MAVGPSWPSFQQSFVCCRGFFVPAAIAEYPGAYIRYFFLLRPPIEGDASAFHRFLTTLPVQQRFTQSTVEARKLVVGDFPMRKIAAARLGKTDARAARKRRASYRLLTNFINVAHLRSTLERLRTVFLLSLLTVKLNKLLYRMNGRPSGFRQDYRQKYVK